MILSLYLCIYVVVYALREDNAKISQQDKLLHALQYGKDVLVLIVSWGLFSGDDTPVGRRRVS